MPRLKLGQHPQPKYQALQLIQSTSTLSDTTNATIFGVHRSTVLRWRNPRTMLDQWEADRYAIAIGKHPSEIWPNWFDVPI